MGDTEISWTHRPGTRGRTWNPVQGCRRVSPGCQHCYAERMAARFAENGWSKGLIDLKTGRWNGVGRLAAHKLAEPLSWREPSTVFVNSMSDLFYEAFSNEEIAAVFGIMAATPQHTYQILTKRPERMREWFAWAGQLTLDHLQTFAIKALPVNARGAVRRGVTWPLPNVWLGTSTENQDTADERIPWLVRTPAVVHFVSAEPLLGAIDFRRILIPGGTPGVSHFSALPTERSPGDPAVLRWVIAGCESGGGARPCEVEWLRSLRDQCEAANVPFFLKQASLAAFTRVGDPLITLGKNSKPKGHGYGGPVIERPYLDGVQHVAFPEVP